LISDHLIVRWQKRTLGTFSCSPLQLDKWVTQNGNPCLICLEWTLFGRGFKLFKIFADVLCARIKFQKKYY
jgi:hypothetical protein